MFLAIYRLIALVVASALVACSTSDDDADDDPMVDVDAGVDPDAREDRIADAGPLPTCSVSPSYGDLGVIPPQLSEALVRVDRNNFVQKIFYQAILNDDADVVVIELFNGFTVFSEGLRTGTFELTGDDLDYATCGICVRIFGDVGPLGDVRQVYMATGGTVTISELGLSLNGRFRTRLEAVELEHVTIHPETFESIPVGDGCRSRIVEMQTDSPTF
jgi:hypothetical protein